MKERKVGGREREGRSDWKMIGEMGNTVLVVREEVCCGEDGGE
jgi:hypothetical protein